ncbi:MAG: type IV pilus twitching motility protein PilT [Planctomycetota bacterium]|jgi:twitching motility protein PilT|nr:type IV pilus twitching motility protein PilT [Planctomycetota bacterium]
MEQQKTAFSVETLIRALCENKGSDLHITAGSPPRIRISGALRPLNLPPLSPEMSQELVYSILKPDQIAKFEREKELDTAFGLSGVGRFRVNVFYQRSAVGASFRTIPFEIMNFEQLGLPIGIFERLCALPRGLILVTGATGSGKSTTLAAMVDHINATEDGHIVTIEDPIEFLHRNKRCLINQREIGPDTLSFSAALKHVLRQDPDTILIGEMRDMETVQLGLELSETGHLTLATLHTSDAVQTINRIIDIFPHGQQPQIRTQLSFVIEAIISQQLARMANGPGRCVALELLIATSAIRANIRDDKIHQIYSAIQTGGKDGMITLNASLAQLVAEGKITRETALASTAREEELVELLEIQTMRQARRKEKAVSSW